MLSLGSTSLEVSDSGTIYRQQQELETAAEKCKKLPLGKSCSPIRLALYIAVSKHHDWHSRQLLLAAAPRALIAASTLLRLVFPVRLSLHSGIAVLNLNCFIVFGGRRKVVLLPSFLIEI